MNPAITGGSPSLNPRGCRPPHTPPPLQRSGAIRSTLAAGPASTSSAFPRAGIDPITDPVTAFGVICTAVELPYRPQVVCLLLHHDHTGAGICVVHDTHSNDAPAEVLELLVDHANHDGRLGAVALASVKPLTTHTDPDDLVLWGQLDAICVAHDVTLLEWWIIGDEVFTPRRAVGVRSRWPSDT